MTYHLVLFGWLIYVEVLEVTSEQKVNLRLRGREDVGGKEGQKYEISRNQKYSNRKKDLLPGFIWLVNICSENVGTTSEKKVKLRLYGGEDVEEKKGKDRNQK